MHSCPRPVLGIHRVLRQWHLSQAFWLMLRTASDSPQLPPAPLSHPHGNTGVSPPHSGHSLALELAQDYTAVTRTLSTGERLRAGLSEHSTSQKMEDGPGPPASLGSEKDLEWPSCPCPHSAVRAWTGFRGPGRCGKAHSNTKGHQGKGGVSFPEPREEDGYRSILGLP